MSARAFASLAAMLLLLVGCGGKTAENPPSPALWEVTGLSGAKGWLFGTVHALPEGFAWRSEALDKAVAASGALVLEIGDDKSGAKSGIAGIFADLSRSPGQPPLSARVTPAQRADLARWLGKARLADGESATIETWAAALMLAQAAQGDDRGSGVETGLVDLADGRPVIELEGARAQLGLFDALPEQDQRDLLAAVLTGADTAEADSARLSRSWRAGDMKAIEAETRKGLLADPELRTVLLVARNHAWLPKVEDLLKSGERPFVAVGAAHVAGADGLPALLARRGWTVTRIQ